MKKALLLCATLCMSAIGFAQQPFATLTHNDSVRVFYGRYALQQAHAAAAHGDVINLSSGSFEAVNLTKAVTIRGAGMFNDPATGRINTVIRNSFNIEITDTAHRLTLMGLYFISGADMTLYRAWHPQFVKCRFQTVQPYYHSEASRANDRTTSAQFINCIVGRWYNYPWNNFQNWQATGTGFYNSVILEMHDYAPRSPDMLVNCIAKQDNSTDNLNAKTILNSILYCVNSSSPSTNGYTSFYTIGINHWRYAPNYNYDARYFDLTNMGPHNLHNYPSSSTSTNPFSLVFQTFRGTYSDGMSMALNDNIATTILGDDSTQVGIYGGQFPWDPSVSNPLIGHCSAARRTDAQGMLQVDIEILNPDTTTNDDTSDDGDMSDFD